MFINLLKTVPIIIGMLIITAIAPNDRPADRKTEESWEKPEDTKARVDRYFEQLKNDRLAGPRKQEDKRRNAVPKHGLRVRHRETNPAIQDATHRLYYALEHGQTTDIERIAAIETFKREVPNECFERTIGDLFAGNKKADVIKLLMHYGAHHDMPSVFGDMTVWEERLNVGSDILPTIVTHSRRPFSQENIKKIEDYITLYQAHANHERELIVAMPSWWDQKDALAQTIKLLQERVGSFAPDLRTIQFVLSTAILLNQDDSQEPELLKLTELLMSHTIHESPEDSDLQPAQLLQATQVVVDEIKQGFSPEETAQYLQEAHAQLQQALGTGVTPADFGRMLQEERSEANHLRTLLEQAQELAASPTTEIPEAFKEQVNQALQTESIIQDCKAMFTSRVNEFTSKAQMYRNLLQLVAQRNAELAQQASGSRSAE